MLYFILVDFPFLIYMYVSYDLVLNMTLVAIQKIEIEVFCFIIVDVGKIQMNC